MGKSSIGKNLFRAAVVAAAAAGAVGQANAAQFRGTWDPVYIRTYTDPTPQSGPATTVGSPFYDPSRGDFTYLYFAGEATFDTGSCGTSDGFYQTSQATGCTGWSVTDIQLTIGEATGYNASLQPTGLGAQYTFNFSNATGPAISSMRIQGGTLVGVAASWHPVAVQEPLGGANISLIDNPETDPLITDATLLPFMNVAFSYQGAGDSFATFGWKAFSGFDFGCTASSTNTYGLECGSQDARVTFTPAIPEPSTYALMGLGLAAVAAMRRRATRKAAQA